jgi:hypothetical protein
MMYLGRVPVIPRPEARVATTPASTPNVRVVSLTEVAAGPVVLYSPSRETRRLSARSPTHLPHDLRQCRMRGEHLRRPCQPGRTSQGCECVH